MQRLFGWVDGLISHSPDPARAVASKPKVK